MSILEQAEDTMFKVPVLNLPDGNYEFQAMFTSTEDGEGLSDENPVVLPSNVGADDFRSLLKALFRPYVPHAATRNV